MKYSALTGFFTAAIAAPCFGQGLYYTGTEAQESLPIKWGVGGSVIYDDNVNPGAGKTDSSFGINPYVGVSFVHNAPRTTWDVYSRLGLIYYLDAPAGIDDINSQSRLGLNVIHRVDERLRLVSRNFVSYELEPDYSYGYASTRQSQEYLIWQLDNSVGYRWTERFGTYTGLRLNGMQYDNSKGGANSDRSIWELYNQFRYQLTPQTVLTADYRYGQTEAGGLAGDSTDQYILVGAEHRFSPTSIGIVRLGAQLRDVDQGQNATSPYLEFAFNSRVTQDFSLRAFTRYGLETYDSVAAWNASSYNFDERETLRIGVSGDYKLSPKLTLFSGIDYIPTTYASGRKVAGAGPATAPDLDEDILNAYLGLSVKLTDQLTGNVSYNFTNVDSDLALRSYDRNRISVGVSAEF